MTPFRPPRWLRGRHAQTVWGALFRLPIRLPLRHERWELPDGDFIDVARMSGATPDAPVVVVCHGLEGSAKAGYVRGLLRDLRGHGFGAVAVNFRGCSGEPNRLPRFYHSGDTGDSGVRRRQAARRAAGARARPGRLLARRQRGGQVSRRARR